MSHSHLLNLTKVKIKKLNVLRGKTQINLFFEPSTRTQSSFELAGKRLRSRCYVYEYGKLSN